jgi:uncharacterized protein
VTLDRLRRFAVARSLFRPTTLGRALRRLGFVQADPIRAPARAQDLVLRHRVRGYRAGDLERRYRTLHAEEDFLVNYGFVTREVQALMHPRSSGVTRSAVQRRRTAELLAFVRTKGTVHPRDVDAHFAHGTVTNYWGGSSSATTHLLVDMHYRGLLRVVGRDAGIRLYGAVDHGPVPTSAQERDARLDALVDVVVGVYAPLPHATLAWLVNRLRYATPQWTVHLKAALARTKRRLAHAHVDRVEWYWPPHESLPRRAEPVVRLLAPFDPVVWDRRRFQLLWGWAYRFEAYTPAPKRQFGYYALPLLWGDFAIGWANVSVREGRLHADIRYIGQTPSDTTFFRELDAELERMRQFLTVGAPKSIGIQAAAASAD